MLRRVKNKNVLLFPLRILKTYLKEYKICRVTKSSLTQ